jgi:hypothetical protein
MGSVHVVQLKSEMVRIPPSFLPDDFYDKPTMLPLVRDRKKNELLTKQEIVSQISIPEEMIEEKPMDIEQIEAIKSERDEIELVKSQIDLYDKLEDLKDRRKHLLTQKPTPNKMFQKRKQADVVDEDDYDPLLWKKKK